MSALSTAPRFYVMGARSPAYDLDLDGRRTFLATDGCGVETIDFVTRQRRRSCKDDVAVMARVADYLSSIGFYWPIVSAQDFPSTAPLHELDAAFSNTVKHIQSETIMGSRMARYAVEMARVISGTMTGPCAYGRLCLCWCAALHRWAWMQTGIEISPYAGRRRAAGRLHVDGQPGLHGTSHAGRHLSWWAMPRSWLR